MKRFLRILIASTLAVLICVTFCSCTYLDELREKQGYYKNDDTYEVIYHGDTYKYLPTGDYKIYDAFDVSIGVAPKNVPLLLAPLYSETFHFPEEDLKNLLVDEHLNIYAIESVYDEYLEMVEENSFDHYCYATDPPHAAIQYGEILPEGVEIVEDLIDNAYFHRTESPSEYKTVALIYACDKDRVILGDSIAFWEDNNGNYYAHFSSNQMVTFVPDEYYFFVDTLKEKAEWNE